MKKLLMVGAVATAAAGFAAAATGMSGHRRSVSSVPGKPAVVVELFTSEGCSSCPPADTVLENLSVQQPVAGVHVIALGEHVDYWDHGGWRDPYSSAIFTQRQNAYANLLRLNQVYTPQMVVHGRTEFVGSDRDRARSTVVQAAAEPEGAVAITATSVGSQIHLHVMTKNVPRHGGVANVFVALTEDGLSTNVLHGENGGRHLAHTAVVRAMTNAGSLSAGNAGASFDADLPRGANTTLANMKGVAFVQAADTGRILGASDVSLRGLGQ
jgi:hypothetical protein